MSRLNNDTLFLIFEELQENSKTLFSCLMVNKLWCEAAIPILWRNPWKYDIDYSNKRYLFATIAFYLPDNIKELLKTKGCQLPPISQKSPFFDYLSFCKSINVTIMNNMIFSIEPSSVCNQFLLQQEFYKLIIGKCPELIYLDMISLKHQIFYFPEAITCLETLRELKCSMSVDLTYFFGLARICRNIQKLIIINNSYVFNCAIVNLIEEQENLKYFEWEDHYFEEAGVSIDDPYSAILPALVKKAVTLSHLKMNCLYSDVYEYDMLKETIPKLSNLKWINIMFNGNLLVEKTYTGEIRWLW